MVVGNVCGLPDDDECDPEKQRVMALAAKDEYDALVAALEAREAEVRYLRKWKAWLRSIPGATPIKCFAELAMSGGTPDACCGCSETLAVHPEPQPPEGVEP